MYRSTRPGTGRRRGRIPICLVATEYVVVHPRGGTAKLLLTHEAIALTVQRWSWTETQDLAMALIRQLEGWNVFALGNVFEECGRCH